VHSPTLAPADVVKHGLAGHAVGNGGVVETDPPVGDVADDLGPHGVVDADAPWRPATAGSRVTNSSRSHRQIVALDTPRMRLSE
jgi:hypothetical protein